MVHRHIGRIRRLLEPGLAVRKPGRFLVAAAGGYRLIAASSDLRQMRTLRDRALGAWRTGRAPDAAGLFAQALGLRRGRTAAGLEPACLTHPDFTAIEAEWLSVVREAADFFLGQGQSHRVLPALRQAADLAPLDESLHSRLLQALRADGRTAQAVQAYEGIRLRLSAEIGQVLRWLAGPIPVLTVDGVPGVGKTTLALHLLHRLAGEFPDGRLHVDLRGFTPGATPLEPAEALRLLLGQLGVVRMPVELHGLAGLYRSLLAAKRILVVLDNAHDPEQIRHLLPGTPRCPVILTSRRRLGLAHTACSLSLDLPTHAQARELLIGRLGATRLTDDHIDRLVTACGRLPLALSLVARSARPRPTLRQVARLDRLRASFDRSYSDLSPPAARTLQLLSRHPNGDVTVAGTAALTGTPGRTARSALAELHRSGLLTELAPGRFGLPDLLHAYAAGLTDTEMFTHSRQLRRQVADQRGREAWESAA